MFTCTKENVADIARPVIFTAVLVGIMFMIFKTGTDHNNEVIKAWSQVDKKINDLQLEVLTLKKQAIDLGYARYNGTNGNWQWVTNK